ncbi:hypothetical protein BH11PLA2_BH11PLA2_00490 [soil metagenome]
MDDLPTINGLQLRHRLGRGSLCDVWAAALNGHKVAVKILRDDHLHDPGMVATIRNELAVGLRVKHRNLVPVFRGSAFKAPYHVVLARVPGYTLRHVLEQDRKLPAWLVIDILSQAASALAKLHAAGYVHGDVKPGNLMIDTAGRVTLIDLGFARVPGSLPPGEGILGTPNYLAPELCYRTFRDTPAADIFALGVTAYELITGELPYPSLDDTKETLLLHRDTLPQSVVDCDVPRSLSTIIDAMLSVEMFQRPKAMAIANALAKQNRRIAA